MELHTEMGGSLSRVTLCTCLQLSIFLTVTPKCYHHWLQLHLSSALAAYSTRTRSLSEYLFPISVAWINGPRRTLTRNDSEPKITTNDTADAFF